MPKSMVISPEEVRRPGNLVIDPIPLNRYRSDIAAERERWGDEALLGAYRDMVLIRAFERMLDSVKSTGGYAGLEYVHEGPSHLSIGQEASVVGLCLPLEREDMIFGSHRSHAEILAKSLQAIRHSEGADLQRTMEEYLDGDILRVVESAGAPQDAEALAIDFVVYGFMAEVFGRRTGLNRGLGGSMHAFFAPLGSMPNNAIVGGSAGIAAGAALFKRVNRRPGIVVACIGDASASCGPTWEALSFAAMDQYRTLWDAELGGAPPVLFNFMNNFYGMGSQTAGETLGFQVLARMGAGVNPDNLHAERVDGYNPLAVAASVDAKRNLLLEGRGPVLLDTVTYRVAGHSARDPATYRTREEIEAWEERDSLRSYGEYLGEAGILDSAERDRAGSWAEEVIERAFRLAAPLDTSPRFGGRATEIESMMFSARPTEAMAPGTPELTIPVADNPRVKALAGRSRSAFDDEGTRLPASRVITLRDALFEALLHRFAIDPTMIAYGEENRDWGGAFGVYRGLTESLPYHRLFNSPISEASIVGSAIGYAMSGGRVVVELMYCDFLGRAGDEVFNQLAKWQAMSAGVLSLPIVLRISVGFRYGAQHSQEWSAMVGHIPGLKVYYPVTPYDAKGMLNLALRGTDPVIFFESQQMYGMAEELHPQGVPAGYYEIDEGAPHIHRHGDDLTILTVGATLYRALEAAQILSERHDLEAEVIDARFLNPLDYGPIAESVRKTGRVLLTSDACERGSMLHTMATTLGRLCFDDLDAPPVVLGARNWITPPVELESAFFPQADWIVDAIHEQLLPLPGYRPGTDQSLSELSRRSAAGV